MDKQPLWQRIDGALALMMKGAAFLLLGAILLAILLGTHVL